MDWILHSEIPFPPSGDPEKQWSRCHTAGFALPSDANCKSIIIIKDSEVLPQVLVLQHVISVVYGSLLLAWMPLFGIFAFILGFVMPLVIWMHTLPFVMAVLRSDI